MGKMKEVVMKPKKWIIAGTVCVCLIIAMLWIFLPVQTNESITIPAVIICDGNVQAENTNLVIDGTWSRSRFPSSRQSFAGKIQIDRLAYTCKEDCWDLDFQVTEEVSGNCLSGGFFYNSDSDFTGYGWLYTDKDHDYYVIVTNQFNNEKDDYLVIAPAETKEAAEQICDGMGLNFLQDSGK